MEPKELTVYDTPDLIFHAKYNPHMNEYSVEVDEKHLKRLLDEAEELTDEQIRAWAERMGCLKEERYRNDDGSIDYFGLRLAKKQLDINQFSPFKTASGWAYQYIDGLEGIIPADIRIYVARECFPGDEWHGVIAQDIDALVKFQAFMNEQGTRINFHIMK